MSEVVTKIRKAIHTRRYEPDANGIMSLGEYSLCMIGPEAYRELMDAVWEKPNGITRMTKFMGLRIVSVRHEGVWFE